jgi:hypothetical protein
MTYLIVSCLLIFTPCGDIESIESVFDQIKKEEDKDKFIEEHEKSDCKEARAYAIALKASKAKDAFWPVNKYQIHKKNYEELSKLINNDPKNIRMRYARLLILEKAPRFLRNELDMNKDKSCLESEMRRSGFPNHLKVLIQKNTSL